MQASILVLEPEIGRTRQIRRALECHGHHLLIVPDAAVALGALRHVQFEILVAPLSPLAISAQALATQAKLLQPQLRLLIVDELELELELELGHDLLYSSVDAYLRKPISDSTLGEAVSALLSRTNSSIPGRTSTRVDEQLFAQAAVLAMSGKRSE